MLKKDNLTVNKLKTRCTTQYPLKVTRECKLLDSLLDTESGIKIRHDHAIAGHKNLEQLLNEKIDVRKQRQKCSMYQYHPLQQ